MSALEQPHCTVLYLLNLVNWTSGMYWQKSDFIGWTLLKGLIFKYKWWPLQNFVCMTSIKKSKGTPTDTKCYFLHSQLESLLQLWLTLSLNTCSGGSEESGSDIFLFNASRVPTIPLNQGWGFSTPLSNLELYGVYIWLHCFILFFFVFVSVFSIHQQFPNRAGVVPQHFPENMVSGSALSHSDD